MWSFAGVERELGGGSFEDGRSTLCLPIVLVFFARAFVLVLVPRPAVS